MKIFSLWTRGREGKKGYKKNGDSSKRKVLFTGPRKGKEARLFTNLCRPGGGGGCVLPPVSVRSIARRLGGSRIFRGKKEHHTKFDRCFHFGSPPTSVNQPGPQGGIAGRKLKGKMAAFPLTASGEERT